MNEIANRSSRRHADPTRGWFRAEQEKARTDALLADADATIAAATATNATADQAGGGGGGGTAIDDPSAVRRVFVGTATSQLETAPNDGEATGASRTGKAVERQRPFWLTGPCPAWCTTEHSDRDRPADRCHVSAPQGSVLLTQAEAVSAEDGSWKPQDVRITLAQHAREIDPLIWCRGHGPAGAWHLTVTEAQELAAALARAVDAARGR